MLFGRLQAQEVIAISKKISAHQKLIALDSNSIVPGTFKLFGPSDSISHTYYKLDLINATLLLSDSIKLDSVRVAYRTLSFKLNKVFSLRETQIIQDETKIEYNERLEREFGQKSEIVENQEELQKVGSISRGVSFGNNQNLSVNSNLDLQLSGKLSDNYNLVAALSDRNIPIQPEGTTSNIQEFDQVYVNLIGKGTNVTLGDFFVSSKADDYFLKTYKKSQGISAFQEFKLENNKTLTAGANVGVTRGRFARNTFNGEEGNQGPYRLTGESGGLFIIVIAGTERVYLNGKALERGEQNEYIIDYNTGEITFTPNQLITSLDRIVVEFQYADNSFERSLMHGLVEQKGSGLNWKVNYYVEQDNRNKPFYTTFSPSDIVSLAIVGDDISQAFKPSADTQNVTENTIRYKKIDTLIGGVFYNDIFVHTSNDEFGKYKVTFSPLGSGNGNYVQETSLINGRVYKWVAPINGVKQGGYEPIIKLIAPKKTRLITLQTENKIGEKTTFRSDLALSKHDENSFSSLDSEDDNGLGIRLLLNHKDSILKRKWKIESSLSAERTSANFKTIERFRGVEFSRTWNRQLSNQTDIITGANALLLGGGKIGLSKQKNAFSHEVALIEVGNLFGGTQQLSKAAINLKSSTVTLTNELTNTTTNDTLGGIESNFSAQGIDINLPIKSLTLNTFYNQEQSLFKFNELDSFFNSSYGFQQLGGNISSADTAKIRFKLGVTQRINKLPNLNQPKTQNQSTDITGKVGVGKTAKFKADLNTTYRIFKDLSGSDSLSENTLLSRLEYRFILFKGLFQTNSYYQIGTGRERQFEVLYLFVGQGLGDYVWADINENGEQDLGEFRPQEFTGQGNYVRTVVNNNQYVKAISNEFYQSINIVPASIWSNKKGFKKALSKFSNQTNGSINRKTTDDNSFNQYNPFALNTTADFLLSTNAQIRNSLYFNRMNSSFSAEYTHLRLLNKNLFVYGFEGQEKEENLFQLRWNATKLFSIFPSASLGSLKSISDAFDLKNYVFDYEEYKLKGQVQKGSNLRFALNIQRYLANDLVTKTANVKRDLIGAEFTYSKAMAGVVTFKLDYIQINFTGEKNSPIGFAMLNGLQPGQNVTWSVITNYQISKQAQIGVNYEGRYSETNKVIQTGSVNARWLF